MRPKKSTQECERNTSHANRAAADHFDTIDGRREEREHALDAFAEADLADGEVGVEAGARAGNANAFIGLHALTIAFLDLPIDADGVARIEGRDGLALGDAGDFFLFERLDQVHRHYRSAQAKGRRFLLETTGKRGV